MCRISVLSSLPVKSYDECEGESIPGLLLDGDPPDVTGLGRWRTHLCVYRSSLSSPSTIKAHLLYFLGMSDA